jgi:hypothetical protein
MAPEASMIFLIVGESRTHPNAQRKRAMTTEDQFENEHDDLYDELVYAIDETVALRCRDDVETLADLAETHADRRTARALRILAQVSGEDLSPDFLLRCADRVDPDVNSR